MSEISVGSVVQVPKELRKDDSMDKTAIDRRPTRHVNCNGCTACCEGDVIYIHPECGDDPDQYITEPVGDGRLTLARRPNGDCVYLDRKHGCTIWERRPIVCRELDCGELYRRLGLRVMRRLVKQKLISRKMFKAAKRRGGNGETDDGKNLDQGGSSGSV